MEPRISETRHVPLTLCLQMLFDSSYSLFGWLFFGMGYIFSLLAVSRCEVLTCWQFSGPLSSTTGVVERIRDTRSIENGAQIYDVDYAFTPPGSALRLHGTAYARDIQPAKGSKVTVEYRTDQPHYSAHPGHAHGHVAHGGAVRVDFPDSRSGVDPGEIL